VQVNGRPRGHIMVPAGTPQDEIERRALCDPKVETFTVRRHIVKVIVVPNKVVNIVVN